MTFKHPVLWTTSDFEGEYRVVERSINDLPRLFGVSSLVVDPAFERVLTVCSVRRALQLSLCVTHVAISAHIRR
jgi:hypothetical protein